MNTTTLGDGLVLRQATTDDTETLVTFNGLMHGNAATGEPNPRIAARTREFIDGSHPSVRPADFLVVEDTNSGAIVSSLMNIRQRWTYGGIPLDVGQIEFVGTDPRYRRRGLVRRQMEEMHRICDRQGEHLQIISGKPWYYRQFGYELGLSLGGARSGARSSMPALAEGASEPFNIRPATADDIPFIAALDEQAQGRSLLSVSRDAAQWAYELEGRLEVNIFRRLWRVITGPDGERVGFLAHPPHFYSAVAWADHYELQRGVSWLEVTPVVLRYLLAQAKMPEQMDRVGFYLGADHPVYHALPKRLGARDEANAWYVRVADLPRFIGHVAPVLEARLAASIAAGHTGVLKLNFYRSGLWLLFERGMLVAVDLWENPDDEEAGASFPDLTFLQLLFGYRSLAQLEHAFADCEVPREEARVLLEILFPQSHSQVWAIA